MLPAALAQWLLLASLAQCLLLATSADAWLILLSKQVKKQIPGSKANPRTKRTIHYNDNCHCHHIAKAGSG